MGDVEVIIVEKMKIPKPLYDQIMSLAVHQKVLFDEMNCRMVNQVANPDGKPLDDIWGGKR